MFSDAGVDSDFQEDGQHGQKIGKSSKIKNQD